MKYFILLTMLGLTIFTFSGCKDMAGSETPEEEVVVDEEDLYTVIINNKEIVISDDSITANWATFAKVTNEFVDIEEGAAVIEYGHLWSSTNEQPNFFNSDGRSQLGITLNEGNFESVLTDLVPEKTYYVRAYFVPSTGDPQYSSIVSTFTTRAQGLVRKADYPGIVPSFSAQAGNKAIVGDENHIWMYDPVSDSWKKLNNVPIAFAVSDVTVEAVGDMCYFSVPMPGSSETKIFSFDSKHEKWEELLTARINFTHALADKIHGIAAPLFGCTISDNPYVPIDNFYWAAYFVESNSGGICGQSCYCIRWGDEFQGEFASNYLGSNFMDSEFSLKYRCEDSQNVLYKNDEPFAFFYCATVFGGKHYYTQTTIVSIFDELYILGGQLGDSIGNPCETQAVGAGLCGGQIHVFDLNTPFADFWEIENVDIGNVKAAAVVNDVIYCGLGNENGSFSRDWYELVP